MDKIRSLILMVYLFGFIGFMPSLIMAAEAEKSWSLAFPELPDAEDDGDLLLPQQEPSLSKEEQQKLVASRGSSATPPPQIAAENPLQAEPSFHLPTGRLSQMSSLGSQLSQAYDQRKLLRAQRHTSLRSPSPAPQQFQSLQFEMPSSASRALATPSPAPTPSPTVFGGTPPFHVSGAGTPSASPFFGGSTPFPHAHSQQPSPISHSSQPLPINFPSIAASKTYVAPTKTLSVARPVAQPARTLSASQSVNLSATALVAFSGKGFAKPRTERKQ